MTVLPIHIYPLMEYHHQLADVNSKVHAFFQKDKEEKCPQCNRIHADPSSFVERGVMCVRVCESAVKLGFSCVTSDSVVGDADINNQVTRSCRVGEVFDYFDISAHQARDPLCLNLLPGPEPACRSVVGMGAGGQR